jgi:tetratricopeptide (TPR) repeat protein
MNKAISIARKYADANSVPMIVAYQQRADAYFNMGNFKEAAKDFNTLTGLYNNETHHQLIQETVQFAHLGDCYYFTGQNQIAAAYYAKAISIWARADNPKLRDYARQFGLDIPKLEVAALAYSRLAEIYQKSASGEIRPVGIETAAEEYAHAARLFYQALPMWRLAQGDGGKNALLCELHLAEVLAYHPQPNLTRVDNIAGGDKWALLDKDPESLFRRVEAGMASESSYGTSHPYYAIALLKHAQYRLSQHDLENYVKLRLQACAILSSKKG